MPSPKMGSKKRKKQPGTIRRLSLHFLKLLLSPIVILWDSFRHNGKLDDTWVFSFMLWLTLCLGLILIGFLITEGPVEHTLTILANVNANREGLAGDVQPVIGYINKYALQYKIDPNLVFAIIKTESNFNPKAISPSGARGLMQIMPRVWREYSDSRCSGLHSSLKRCSKDCIFEPEANIRVGVKYFHALLNRYHGRVDLALEAYNAGFTNVWPGQEPKFQETRNYLQKTLTYWQGLRNQMLDFHLQNSLYYENSLKWLFGVGFILWLIFFWWINRKLLSKR